MREPDWAERTVAVVTPENVEFRFELAGLGHRVAAWTVDLGIMVVAGGVLALVGGLLSIAAGGFGAALGIVLFNVVWFGYFWILEAAWNGRTVGKRIVGIRVIDRRGFRITWVQSGVRNLVRMVDSFPMFYLVGAAASLFHREGLRLGDVAAGTVVVKVPSSLAPAANLAPADRVEAMERDFAVAERVRRRLKTPERDLLGALALRRDRMEETARHAIFEAAAAKYSDLLDLHRPPHLSAERFVLTLASLAWSREEKPFRGAA